MRRALVEGSKWMGCWTEFAVEALEELGFSVDVVYSNQKALHLKAVSMLGKIGLVDAKKSLSKYYCSIIVGLLKKNNYDLYLSVSGKLDSKTLIDIRNAGIKTKIVYWIGDRFAHHIKAKFDDLYECHELIDSIAFAEPTVRNRLIESGYEKIHYLPFGVSDKFHKQLNISNSDREKFECDVSFVITRTPDREELVRYLNEHLDKPVALWGRGWQGTGLNCRGRLSLEDVLKVYACSKISLNLHQAGIEGGNMRYFEVPAVGGFQLCDWKQGLPREDYGELVQTFKNRQELVTKIRYFLTHEEERKALTSKLKKISFERCTYKKRFETFFEAMNFHI